jgi:hypothetical protein
LELHEGKDSRAARSAGFHRNSGARAALAPSHRVGVVDGRRVDEGAVAKMRVELRVWLTFHGIGVHAESA